jgi:hypothetical protein
MSDESRLAGANWSPGNEHNDEHSKETVSRRGFIEKSIGGAALVGTTVLPAWAAIEIVGYAPQAYARGRRQIPKEVAQYQYHPKGPQRCGVCVHFRPPGNCEIVAGQISPEGWCRYFRSARARRGARGTGSSY